MIKLLALALSLPLAACVVGPGAESGDDGSGNGNGNGNGNGSGNGDAYVHVTSATTWSGTVDVAKNTMVDAGVTLTIMPGTIVKIASGVSISVKGTVDVQGTKASVVTLSPTVAGQHHYGFSVGVGGVLTMAYGVQTGGGIDVEGGSVTVTDTLMSQAAGDFLVISAGTANVSYSAIGVEPGGVDTTHCDMHFGGAGTTIKITHSNISTSSYGLMLYGGTGVDLTYNNWFGNQIQIDTVPGTSADVSYGWFDKGAPAAGAGAILTYTNPAAARLPATEAGPR